jgi:hypothetical protein
MYVIRNIFQLKFAHYKHVKALLDEGKQMGMFSDNNTRILTDFTGEAYRLILEHTHESLAKWEDDMKNMGKPEWQTWYAKFTEHVEGSYREVLKVVM